MEEIDAIEATEEKSSPYEKFEALASHIAQLQQNQEIAPSQKTHSSHKTENTISKASSSPTLERSPRKPVIPVPNVKDPECANRMYDLIRHQIKNEKLSADVARLNIENSIKSLEKLQKSENQMIELLKEYSKIKGQRHTWDILQSIASYFSIASSFAIGVGISTSAGTIAGGLMVAASGLGLVNEVARDYGFWEKLAGYFSENAETNQRVAKSIETFLTLSTVGTTLFAISSGQVPQNIHELTSMFNKFQKNLPEGLSVITLAGSISQGVTSAGSSITSSRIHRADAALTKNQNDSMTHRFNVEDRSKQAVDALQSREVVDQNVIKAVLASEESQKIK